MGLVGQPIAGSGLQGALDAYRHVTPDEQNQNEKQKDALSGLGITKEVVGFHGFLMRPLFGGDILRR
jgi:hypothetical protein